MNDRINQVTAWYNTALDNHKRNKGEFNRRFAPDGTIDLTSADPEVVQNFGRLEKESEILDALGVILHNEVEITAVADDETTLD